MLLYIETTLMRAHTLWFIVEHTRSEHTFVVSVSIHTETKWVFFLFLASRLHTAATFRPDFGPEPGLWWFLTGNSEPAALKTQTVRVCSSGGR